MLKELHMPPPQLPENEKQRQEAVEKYQLLDTMPEEVYDNITALTAYICDVPISLITLLDKDRNYFKSHYGTSVTETARSVSFCGHAINNDEPITIVEDTRKDERFIDNPMVEKFQILFYAGATLVDSDGYKLGTLCVFDHKPRQLTGKQKEAMNALAVQVIKLFELRYKNLELMAIQDQLREVNQGLEKFAYVISHDLRSPLTNIVSLAEFLEKEYEGVLDETAINYLNMIKTSSHSLKNYVTGLLSFYKSENFLDKDQSTVIFSELMEELKEITNIGREATFQYPAIKKKIKVNKAALMQILINLVTNGIKYNEKPEVIININFKDTPSHYLFEVKDNGNGISEKHLNKIFDLFTIVEGTDKNGNVGTGIGLATVKKMVESLGGKISVNSTVEKGSTFSFSIAKP